MRHWVVLASLLVFAASAIVFLPAGRHGFVNWDDESYFLSNTAYRGLGGKNFAWFFTTTYMGHYQPLNWLSYAIDYSISGLNPGRLHLTQALLHGVAALLFFTLARRLTALCDSSLPPGIVTMSGAVAALLFALHPLRVESVAWASARADILATIFYLAAVLMYVRAARTSNERPLRSTPLALVVVLFICALLSKEMAVTLPAILLLLDIYPLGRLPLAPYQWTRPPARRVLMEKIPFFVIALLATINAFVAADQGVASFTTHPLRERLAQLPVSLIFYPYKTLVPTDLSPLYDYPPHFGWGHPRVWASLFALIVLTALLWLVRKRAPALVAAAIAYAVFILPVTGLTQRGMQMTADRYSYLSCLPWALMGGYLFVLCLRRRCRTTVAVTLVVLAALLYRTHTQTNIWADSITLWEHAAHLDPFNSGAFAHLGQAYETLGRHEEAIAAYKKALSLRPHHPNVQRNLGGVYNRLFRDQEAIEAYLADLADQPDRLESHYYLAVTYERVGDDQYALEHYRETLRIDPNHAAAHAALGRLFLKHGFFVEAEPRLRRALELSPEHLEALELLAKLCAETGRMNEAGAIMERAIQIARRRGDEKLVADLRQIRQQLLAAPASRPAASR